MPTTGLLGRLTFYSPQGAMEEASQWWIKVADVREALRSDETRAQVVTAIPHADWCCTKGCVQPDGTHQDVEFDAGQPILSAAYPCPGDCTCEVGMIVPQVLAVLAGGGQ
jgi:hypothetical protein